MILKYGLYAAWVIATTSCALPIYLIEVQHWPTDRLAWYQLSLMIPLSFILGRSAWVGDLKIFQYAFPLSLVGLVLSAYHTMVEILHFSEPTQKFIYISHPKQELIVIEWNIDLPLWSFVSFLLISILLYLVRKKATPPSS